MSKKFLFSSFFSGEQGAIAVLAAMVFPVVLGMAALGVDSGYWMMERRNLQTAADAAALAAAWEAARQHETPVMQQIAEDEAVNNGFQVAREGTLEMTYSDSVANALGEVTVTLEQDSDLYFARMLIPDQVRVAAQARAIITEPGMDFCILSLDSSASGALTTSGAVDLLMPDCGIAVNSSADDAIDINGNVDIDVEDINIVGDIDVSGGSADVSYETLVTDGRVVFDPYADVEIPSFAGCTQNQMKTGLHINQNKTLSPGVYCGGITITGNNTVTFSPGVYILDGGGLSISGSGAIVANDVTVILTNSGGTGYGTYGTFDITGSRHIQMSATDSGDTAGIVLFQDRNAPTTGTNRILGSNIIEVDGVIYVPSQEVNYGGGGVVSSDVCTQIIGRTVVLHGTPYLGTACDGSSTLPIGLVRARLSG